MDLINIVNMQNTLDQRIYDKFSLSGEKTFTKRKLALLVEIGELANETRCFKFWSLKDMSEKQIIIEELVDCVHFVISIGITMNINFEDLKINNLINNDLTDQFLKLYSSTINIEFNNNDTFYKMFDDLFTLTYSLGFSNDEVFDAYILKNKINHERQNNDY